VCSSDLSAELNFLTTAENSSLAETTCLFDKVLDLNDGPGRMDRFTGSIRMGMQLARENYDIVLDLQRNIFSRIIRWISRPRSWSEFDRFSPYSAFGRTIETVRLAGIDIEATEFGPLVAKDAETVQMALTSLPKAQPRTVVVLNPGGLWPTRNWPMQNYISLARLLMRSRNVQFLVIGTERMAERARMLEKALGPSVLNLTGSTSISQALVLIQSADLVISEDSGLMHMAWCSGRPTIALFGSTNHVWSSPLGAQTVTFHSGDLPCGDCESASCVHQDVHCLTRVTPEAVFHAAQQLLSLSSSSRAVA
jgi:heptosyltransferase-2